MFGQFKGLRSTISWPAEIETPAHLPEAPQTFGFKSNAVDPSCNKTITIQCIQQLYNFVGVTANASGNSIGITGFLDQYANNQDLQSFYAEQRPDALNSTFKFVSVKGSILSL